MVVRVDENLLKCAICLAASALLFLAFQSSNYAIAALYVVAAFLVSALFLLAKMILTASSRERMKKVIPVDYYPFFPVPMNTRQNASAFEKVLAYLNDEMLVRRPWSVAFCATLIIAAFGQAYRFLDMASLRNWVLMGSVFFFATAILYVVNLIRQNAGSGEASKAAKAGR